MNSLYEKAKYIRLAIFDVDGVMTTGRLVYKADGTEDKEFYVLDGQGIKLLQQSGVTVGVITARASTAVEKRMHSLGITHFYQGTADKLIPYEHLKQTLQLSDIEIAYTGDDLPDLPLIRRAGLGMSVPNAPSYIQQHADGVTKAAGGEGAVREICELIMMAQGTYDQMIEQFLK